MTKKLMIGYDFTKVYRLSGGHTPYNLWGILYKILFIPEA